VSLASSSTESASLVVSAAVTEPPHIFCGRCGTPNPADNRFCRRCGHRLADDVIDAPAGTDPTDAEPGPPTARIEGIELQRFPLVHPESGEPIEISPPVAPPRRDSPPPPRRSSVIIWSLGIHTLSILLFGLISMVLFSHLEPQAVDAISHTDLAQVLDLLQRLESGELSPEQFESERRRVIPMDDAVMLRMQLLVHGFVLIGFFLGGLLSGRLWRPRRVLDVGLASAIVGGLLSLCFCNPFVWALGFAVSLAGASIGKRMK
jgi:hypothetical protein